MASTYGFSLEHPSILPDCVVLHGLVSEWLLQRTDDRTGFYSALEDQTAPAKKHSAPAGQATGKKANQPKRITNNMISDQLAALAAQMQFLSQRQDSLEKSGLISSIMSISLRPVH